MKREVITHNDRIVFETIESDSEISIQYPRVDEALFIHIEQGSNISYTPEELIELDEESLAFSNFGNIIFKSVPSKDKSFKATIIHIHKDIPLESISSYLKYEQNDAPICSGF